MAGGWNALGLESALAGAAESELGILPTAIQDETIPLLLGGCDVVGTSHTGSGKTGAFALPILQLCHERKLQLQSQSANAAATCSARSPPPPPLKYEMSRTDRDKLISVDASGLRVQSRDVRQWAGCRCTAGIDLSQISSNTSSSSSSSSSSFYYEVRVCDEGIVRLGYATADGSLNLGTDGYGWGYGGTGMLAHRNKFEHNGSNTSFGKGDVIGCLLEVFPGHACNDKEILGSISFTKNGILLGKAFDLENLGSAQKKDKTTPRLFPVVCLKNAEVELHFMGNFCYRGNYKAIGELTAARSGGVRNPRNFEADSDHAAADGARTSSIHAIVLEPTRDLARQTALTFQRLSADLAEPKVHTALLIGGTSPKAVLSKLDRNSVDIIVATPPICASFMKQGKIKAGSCNVFLLDEADKLLRNETLGDILAIYARLPVSTDSFNRLQVCLFSATLHSKEVKDLASKICHRPFWVDLSGREKGNGGRLPATVHHAAVTVDPSRWDAFMEKRGESGSMGVAVQTDSVHRGGKLEGQTDWGNLSPDDTLSERIKVMKPYVFLDLLERFKMELVLVFCRTNLDCDNLEQFLKQMAKSSFVDKDRYGCAVLAGMRSMRERQTSLKRFQDGEVRILIATDVAARGLDIKELPFVINMTLPDDDETYVHRVGRAGRAQRIGLAISLVGTEAEKCWYCQKNIKPPCEDTRLYREGGNCAWLKEFEQFKSISTMLAKNKVGVTKLSSTEMKIPADMENLINGKAYGDHLEASAINPELRAHLDEVSIVAKELSAVEFNLQGKYFSDLWRK